MERNEFINAIKEVAEQFGEVTVEPVHRADRSYMGLMIKKVGIPTPVINLDRLYERYQEGKPIEDCIEEAKKILNMKPDMPINIQDLTNWNKVKDKLYLRLVGSIADNGAIYKKVADMYLVPYISLSEEKGLTTKVTPELIGSWNENGWNGDADTVFKQAETNQEILRPVTIMSMAEKLGLPDENLGIFIVSTESGVCGASAILYNGVVDKLKDMIGDFYILPSSIHETIVIPKDSGKSIEGLKEMVEFINENEVDEEERLTNSVYTFDFDTKELIQVA